MKYAVIVPDGLGDWPIAELGNKTPLEAAHTPNLDQLAKEGILGTLQTVPPGMYPGSDVCGLSLMGYDPKSCYTGRAPLEAASLGIKVGEEDKVFRCNLVTAKGDILEDYSAGHVSTEEAKELISTVSKAFGTKDLQFFPGKMYRHILLCKKGNDFEVQTAQPHDIQGQKFEPHLPKGRGSDIFTKLTLESRSVLENHPINQKRTKEGKSKANMIWLWGGGVKPKLEPFHQKFKGIKGGVISAVDLLQGLGHYLGWRVIQVPGATGYFDTDYKAKAKYAIEALKDLDLIFVHVEATDEAGHSGLAQEKKKAIERIDEAIVGPLHDHLRKQGSYRLFVAPDHYTPTAKKTHIADPVPFIFIGSDTKVKSGKGYTEANAKSTGVHVEKGYLLMRRLIEGWDAI
ncbi:MAG: cofactor-independent phosphoglycerate mutase [Candidatus Omnitrophica bacterium]|nr:cofactor-independent phosphoglycerate mutase [Candidatus Omnitrophota bacterium]